MGKKKKLAVSESVRTGLFYEDFNSINVLTGYLLRNHYYQGQWLIQTFRFFQGELYILAELPEMLFQISQQFHISFEFALLEKKKKIKKENKIIILSDLFSVVLSFSIEYEI